MQSGWEGAADGALRAFGLGYEITDNRRREEIDRVRQAKIDALAAADKGGYGGDDPVLKSLSDRMAKTQSGRARHEAAMADWLEERYRGGPKEQAEQAVAAKLKALNEGISSIDSEERSPLNPMRWFFGSGLSPADAAMREKMRGRRTQLLGIQGDAVPSADADVEAPAAPAPASSLPAGNDRASRIARLQAKGYGRPAPRR